MHLHAEGCPWYFASFLSQATGIAARSKVPMPRPSTPTDIVSGGSGVGDGVGVGVGVRDGAGVGVELPEHADRSTAAIADEHRAGGNWADASAPS